MIIKRILTLFYFAFSDNYYLLKTLQANFIQKQTEQLVVLAHSFGMAVNLQLTKNQTSHLTIGQKNGWILRTGQNQGLTVSKM